MKATTRTSESKKILQKVKLGNNEGLHSIFYHLEPLLKWQKGENPPPLFVDISPTSKCNHNCFFCFTEWVRQKPKTIDGDLLIKIFSDMAAFGVNTCEIQGTGEPFLNKALPDAIVAGNKGGMNICVVTNGSVLTKKILDKIMPHLAFLRISNLESSAETYAKTHGCPESHWGIVVKNIEEAVKIRNRQQLPVVLTATVMVFDYNVKQLVPTLKLLRDLGIDIAHVKSPGILPLNTNHKWDTSIYKKNKECFTEAKNLETDSFKVNCRTDYFEFHDSQCEISRQYEKCYGTEFAVHIASDSKIYPCYMHWEDPEFALGDLSKNSFEEIWNGEQRKKVMARFYKETDLRKCIFHCKQHSINRVLWQLQNPPVPNVF